MTHVLGKSALSLTAAAALLLSAGSMRAQQNQYPSYGGNGQQPSYNGQKDRRGEQQGYPNAQQQGYPANSQNGGMDRDHDQNRGSAENGTEQQREWPTDQILTATVHQAWMLSGRNEQNFFGIVRQLAEISARNRDLVLPDDPTAGKKAGEFIKEQARADHDQLLYDIVDKAVRMTGKPAPEAASAESR